MTKEEKNILMKFFCSHINCSWIDYKENNPDELETSYSPSSKVKIQIGKIREFIDTLVDKESS